MARFTGPMVPVIAAATTYNVWLKSAGKKAIPKHIYWSNRSGFDGFLQIGATINAAWAQLFPDILMLTGFNDDQRLPVFGNTLEGYVTNATVGIVCAGDIQIRCTVAGAGPTPLLVQLEVEEV